MKTQKAEAVTDSRTVAGEYQYSGDVNIEYGGTFFDLSDWEHGYVNAVRVTDLDSGCGFDGAVLIEKLTVIIDNEEQNKKALECCGFDAGDVGRLQLAEAVMQYGYYDPANEYYEPANEVIQTQQDGPMSFDGWKATKRVLTENLLGYIKNTYGV